MPTPLPPSSLEPFDLRPATATGRALLLHGFTGTPYEVLPLGLGLRDVGYHVVGPLLPGHGRTPLDLSVTTGAQLLQASRDALLAHSKDGPVVLGGLSTGALLAAVLAAAHPDRVSALLLLAPALSLGPKGQAAIHLSRRGLARVMPTVPKEVPGGDCGDPEGRALNPTYPVIPLGGLPALGDLQHAARASLPLVRAPTLVAHGTRDDTVPVAVASVVAGLLKRAVTVERKLYSETRHLMPLDTQRDLLLADVVDFLRRNARNPSPGA